ncbi:MAG: septum formation initiator family protein [Hyphomonadaceae bacterium]
MPSFKPGPLSFGLSALILYLAANAVTGRAGLLSALSLQEREQALLSEAAAIAHDREELRARIRALSEKTLDLDVLEETARRQLGAAAPGEIVFDLAQNGNAPTP